MVKVLGGVSYLLLFFKYRGTSLQNNISEKKTKDWLKSIVHKTYASMKKCLSGKSVEISMKSFKKNCLKKDQKLNKATNFQIIFNHARMVSWYKI